MTTGMAVQGNGAGCSARRGAGVVHAGGPRARRMRTGLVRAVLAWMGFARMGGVRVDDARMDDLHTDDLRMNDVRSDGMRLSGVRSGGVPTDDARMDDARMDDVRPGGAWPGGVRSGGDVSARPAGAPGRRALTSRGRIAAVLLAVLLALAGFAAVFPQVARSDMGDMAVTSYTVRPGDTLWDYAARITPAGGDVSETVATLMELNGLQSAGIEAGQRLVVPMP